MKSKLLLFLVLFSLQNGHSKEQTYDLNYVSKKGQFKQHCHQDGFCTLNINGLDISTKFPYIGQNEDFISPYSYEEKGIYLLKLYHGDGCPSMYRLLHLEDGKKHYISEPFGNCNEFTDFTINLVKHDTTIQFPTFKEASREALTYTYSFSNTSLKQKINSD